MHKIILVDNQAIFRTGTARVLAMEDDLRIIAHCLDCPRFYVALTTFRGAIVIVASSMRPDWAQVLADARLAGSRLILVEENGEVPSAVLTVVAWIGIPQGLQNEAAGNRAPGHSRREVD
jgi:DNA-binding NarL/FixJ family response regulator